MIEVEKKFHITEEEVAALIEDAVFIGENKFTDVYYDSVDYRLTTNDSWLRSRNGAFEYKVRFDERDESEIDRYYEFHDAEIRRELHLSLIGSIVEAIAKSGYAPFAEFTTTRRSYKKDGFRIDIDSMDFGYQIGEVELIVSESKAADASKRILAFARSHGLQTSKIRGKLIEYICRFRPEHRAALKKAGFRSV